LWIFLGTWCALSGWVLSLLGMMTRSGYLVSVMIGTSVGLIVFKNESWRWFALWKKSRWSRPLPFLYVSLLFLSAIGGMLYAPNNYDFLTYRLPRVLHWWSEGGWHWINTENDRMNYSGVGFEWMMSPLMVLTHSDRFFFLINIIAFVFLPGLFFRLAILAGVSKRAAWNWMWLLPSGYCFALQAGSVSNDSFASIYALAAVFFMLRASGEGNYSDFLWGIMAAALLTGAKASNLPLLLPCFISAILAWRVIIKSWIRIAVVLPIALAVSFLPLAALNDHYAGHWSGDPLNTGKMRLKDPVAGLVGNSLQLVSQSVVPPVLPGAKQIAERAINVLPESFRQYLEKEYPRFNFFMGELVQEEAAGLGIGVSVLLVFALAVGIFAAGRQSDRAWIQSWERNSAFWVVLSSWISLIAYMMMMGSENTARLLSSYYPLVIIPLLALPGQLRLIRSKAWKFGAILAMASTLVAILLTPSRPLFPAETVLGMLEKSGKFQKQVDRARMVYEVYGSRNDVLAPLRAELKPDDRVIGAVLGGNEPEVSLWKPYGERRVVFLGQNGYFPEQVNAVVVSQQGLNGRNIPEVKLLAQSLSMAVVGEEKVIFTVSRGAESCYLLRAEGKQ